MPALHAKTPVHVVANARHSPRHGCAVAVLCASISGVLTHLSGTGKKLSASDSEPQRIRAWMSIAVGLSGARIQLRAMSALARWRQSVGVSCMLPCTLVQSNEKIFVFAI